MERKHTTNRKEKISVVIPVFNRRHCIMHAVNSVLQQQKNNFDYEIIVSDDGSTDGTSELFKKNQKNNSKIIYFWSKNGGVNVARNRGVKKAKGDYILFLDSDDWLKKNAFLELEKNRNKFTQINFFGTENEKTKKRMYFFKKEGKYSYKEWLEGKSVRGEFLPIVKKEVFKTDLFNEERFCFEGFFWNRIIKKYGLTAFNIPLREYSFEQENRLSKQLLSPEKANQRYLDYKEYLKQFEKDYISLKLKKQLSSILLTTGFYATLAGNKSEGRQYIKKSVKLSPCIKNIFGFLITYAGKKPLKILAKRLAK